MMRTRLLSRLHRVFNPTPEAAPALRLRSPGGLRWRIADDALTVARPGQPDLTTPLAGLTIAALGNHLAAAGVAVALPDPALERLGALALLPGAGDQDASDGDRLDAYGSILWSWADAVGRALDRAKADIGQALNQLTVPTADGEWLDLWGSYFGVARRADEADAAFAERILQEPRRPRSNPAAMRANIRRATGAEVHTREPWREMMTLGRSRLSGGDKLPDGREYGYHTLQLVSRRFEDWDAVTREAEADRPAGTRLLPPVTLPPPFGVVADAGVAAGLARHDLWSGRVQDSDGQIIGYNFRPSTGFVRRNPAFAIFDNWSGEADGLPDPAGFRPTRTVCKGEIILNVQGPLGGLQARLPGRRRVERGAPLTASGSARLSDHLWRLVAEPVEEWRVDRLPVANPAPDYPGPFRLARLETRFLTAARDDGNDSPTGWEDTHALAVPTLYGDAWVAGWDERRWGAIAFVGPDFSSPRVTSLTPDTLASGTGEPFTDADGAPLRIERTL